MNKQEALELIRSVSEEELGQLASEVAQVWHVGLSDPKYHHTHLNTASHEGFEAVKGVIRARRSALHGHESPIYLLHVVIREHFRRASGVLATQAYYLLEAGEEDAYRHLIELAHRVDLMAMRLFDYIEAKDDLDGAMTVEEVAKTYGRAASTVRGSIFRGYIPARKSGKNWLIRRSDAEARWGDKS